MTDAIAYHAPVDIAPAGRVYAPISTPAAVKAGVACEFDVALLPHELHLGQEELDDLPLPPSQQGISPETVRALEAILSSLGADIGDLLKAVHMALVKTGMSTKNAQAVGQLLVADLKMAGAGAARKAADKRYVASMVAAATMIFQGAAGVGFAGAQAKKGEQANRMSGEAHQQRKDLHDAKSLTPDEMGQALRDAPSPALEKKLEIRKNEEGIKANIKKLSSDADHLRGHEGLWRSGSQVFDNGTRGASEMASSPVKQDAEEDDIRTRELDATADRGGAIAAGDGNLSDVLQRVAEELIRVWQGVMDSDAQSNGKIISA